MVRGQRKNIALPGAKEHEAEPEKAAWRRDRPVRGSLKMNWTSWRMKEGSFGFGQCQGREENSGVDGLAGKKQGSGGGQPWMSFWGDRWAWRNSGGKPVRANAHRQGPGRDVKEELGGRPASQFAEGFLRHGALSAQSRKVLG